MLLRARIVVPVTAPPVEDGAVAVSGDRITAVGRWKIFVLRAPNHLPTSAK